MSWEEVGSAAGTSDARGGDYPVHRYFLYAKQLELTLGGATRYLLTIGRMLADEAA